MFGSSTYLTREERVKLKETARIYGIKGNSPETEVQITSIPIIARRAKHGKAEGSSRSVNKYRHKEIPKD